MSTLLPKKLTWMSFCFLLLPALANAQARPIAFGQGILDTILPPSHMETFAPPFLASGDVVLIRASPESGLLRPRIRLINQTGNTVETAQTTSYFLGVQLVWQVPAGAGGLYTIVISDFNSTNTGTFCLFSISQAILAGSSPSAAIQSDPSNGIACAGSDFTLAASTNVDNPVYEWSGPNGFSSGQPSITFANATTGQTGMYSLTVTDEDDCILLTASKLITVIDFDATALSDPEDGTLCEGEPFTLSADTDADTPAFSWVDHNLGQSQRRFILYPTRGIFRRNYGRPGGNLYLNRHRWERLCANRQPKHRSHQFFA